MWVMKIEELLFGFFVMVLFVFCVVNVVDDGDDVGDGVFLV